MAADVVIHGFETSNNIKVRVALGFKDIPYTFHTIDPKERTEIERLSGQRLTPIMVHGETVLFDSAAIIRYVEANFRDRPSLFGASHGDQWIIEDVELFARHTLAMPMMTIVHRRIRGESVDEALQTRCATEFAEAVGTLEAKLSGSQWLVGDSMSVADVSAAAVMYRVRQTGLFEQPVGSEALRGWENRVLAFDRYLKQPGA